MTISGFGLLQAQRLVTRNDLDRVQNREIIIDWTGLELLVARLERSPACLSGHLRWNLTDVPLRTGDATFLQLFAFCRDQLHLPDPITLSPLGHPLYMEATCACGPTRNAAGTRFATPPTCARCGERQEWRMESALHHLREHDAEAPDIADRSLAELGLPRDGALIVARAPGQAPLHMLLANAPESRRSP